MFSSIKKMIDENVTNSDWVCDIFDYIANIQSVDFIAKISIHYYYYLLVTFSSIIILQTQSVDFIANIIVPFNRSVPQRQIA